MKRLLHLHRNCARAIFPCRLTDIKAEAALHQELEALRTQLLRDPYFRGVPSFAPENGKTALFFHAKDDLPEVRREVFSILLRHDFRFYAVVKSMKSVFEYVKSRNERDDAYHYSPNELYDLTVRMLFKNRLHLGDTCTITFAKRGKSDRTNALQANLQKAKVAFLDRNPHLDKGTTIDICIEHAKNRAGLQCADYCLWALQRFFEKGESRYLALFKGKFGLIHDVDDKSQNPYGNYLDKRTGDLLDATYLQNRQI